MEVQQDFHYLYTCKKGSNGNKVSNRFALDDQIIFTEKEQDINDDNQFFMLSDSNENDVIKFDFYG